MTVKQKETTDIYSHGFKNFDETLFKSELWNSVLEINKNMLIFHSANFLKLLITSYKDMPQ